MTENQKNSLEITVNSGSQEGCNQGLGSTNSGVIRKGHETDFKTFPKPHIDPSTWDESLTGTPVLHTISDDTLPEQ